MVIVALGIVLAMIVAVLLAWLVGKGDGGAVGDDVGVAELSPNTMASVGFKMVGEGWPESPAAGSLTLVPP